MSAENRLTADQLAALAPGDFVTIEVAVSDRRPTLTTGRVVRIAPTEIVVSTAGRSGGKFIQRYGRRDGVRSGRGGRAELVQVDPNDRAAQDVLRQRTQIDVIYRQWSRRRDDVEAARQLHDAIEAYLQEIAAHTTEAPCTRAPHLGNLVADLPPVPCRTS